MTDPDCLGGTAEIKHCVPDLEICSPLGHCTLPIYTEGEVSVSSPCHDLMMPGEVALYGYIGHNDDFEKDGGKKCETCPYDELYDGKANKNENNQYVCQYRPEGEMNSVDILAMDPSTITTYLLLSLRFSGSLLFLWRGSRVVAFEERKNCSSSCGRVRGR